MNVHPMWNHYPELKIDLSNTLELIDSHIKINNKTIEQTVKKMVHSGGKLLRPAYSILCSQIGPEQNKERATAVAAALECLHMATLVHDDVIDESDTRHGIPTIHSEHGNKYAIYAGDYLFALCFKILTQHSSSLSNLEFSTRGIEKILTGELDQLQSRFEAPLSVKSYLSRISGKTAQLFATSCYSGAVESRANRKLAMHAWNMGHYIGMAFQIMDDILDHKSNKETLGKPVMNDIRQGIYTLPLIYAMKENRKVFWPLLEKRDQITDEEMQLLMEMIHQYNGIHKAEKLAERYTNKAIKELEKLPPGAYRDQLYQITSSLLSRKM